MLFTVKFFTTLSEIQYERRKTKPVTMYSHLSNNSGGWNKRGGEAKIAKSLNVEAGILSGAK